MLTAAWTLFVRDSTEDKQQASKSTFISYTRWEAGARYDGYIE